MSFIRVREGEWVDADRDAARAFLDAHGLHPDPAQDTSAYLLHEDGTPFTFDGYPTDLHVDSYETGGKWQAGIWHATLSEPEVEFIYDLCVAVGLAVCNHQGDPLMIIPAATHSVTDLAGLDEAPVFVNSADELRIALSSGFDHFLEWRDRVIRE